MPSTFSSVPFCSQSCLPKHPHVSPNIHPSTSAPLLPHPPHCRSFPGLGAGVRSWPSQGRGGAGREGRVRARAPPAPAPPPLALPRRRRRRTRTAASWRPGRQVPGSVLREATGPERGVGRGARREEQERPREGLEGAGERDRGSGGKAGGGRGGAGGVVGVGRREGPEVTGGGGAGGGRRGGAGGGLGGAWRGEGPECPRAPPPPGDPRPQR